MCLPGFGSLHHTSVEQHTRIKGVVLSCKRSVPLLIFSQTDPSSDPTRQKLWFQTIADCQWNKLLDDADPTSVSRLRGCQSPGSGDWLNALPSGTLGLRLSDEHFSTAVALLLGAPVCSTHTCVCDVALRWRVQLSITMLSYATSSRVDTHDTGWATMLSSGLLSLPKSRPPSNHSAFLSRTDGKRPDGANLLPWKGGKPLVWDFTCRQLQRESQGRRGERSHSR